MSELNIITEQKRIIGLQQKKIQDLELYLALFKSGDKFRRMQKEISDLESKLSKAVEALEFYADFSTYRKYNTQGVASLPVEDIEMIFQKPFFGKKYGGKTARQALKEINEGKE